MSLVGTRLGKYEIVAEIGHGGMSTVYRAHDTQLKRDVAVKVMHTFLAEQPEAKERFHREAVAVARLRHPHIIEIFDYSGEDAASSYIVMELVDGSALADVLRSGPLGCPEVGLLLARPIADALFHAHGSGGVHRDLKPENILLGRGGELKLTDFGIARILDNQAMTMTGTLLGSPAYMAPEYIEGYPTDERADVFSFGAMLYYLVVGRLPFEAPSPHALLKRIAEGVYPPPQQTNPATHAGIARIIARCLKKLPEQRYASAAEVRDAIDAHLRALQLDWERELPDVIADPRAYASALETRLAPRYLALGREALSRGEHGAAVEHLDRVLCIEPKNTEVRKMLARIGRRTSALRVARIGFAAVSALAVAGGVVYGAVRWQDAQPKPVVERPVAPRVEQPVVTTAATEPTTPTEPTRAERPNTPTAPNAPTSPNAPTRPTAPSQPTTTAPTPPTEPTTPTAPSVANAPKHREVRFNAVNVVTAFVDDAPEPAVRDRVGPFVLDLTHGNHRLKFTNPLAYDSEQNLTVDDVSPAQIVVVRLQPLPAKLIIDKAPDGAIVEVAGRTWLVNAQTRNEPIFVPLPLGSGSQSMEVIVRHGQLEYRRTIDFKPGQERHVEVGPL